MKAFELSDGTVINLDHIMEIPNIPYLVTLHSGGGDMPDTTVEFKMADGSTKQIAAKDAVEIREIVLANCGHST